MRILVCCGNLTNEGGLGTYLRHLLPGLVHSNAAVSLFHEFSHAGQFSLGESPHIDTFDYEGEGKTTTLRRVRDWKPDLVFVHNLTDPVLEREILSLCPSVLVMHVYHGTCVSGLKSWTYPRIKPCSRKMGLGCLLHYYPHRCGGLNPMTMFRSYGTQAQYQKNLVEYSRVVTLSKHMRDECIRHGVSPENVSHLPFFSRLSSIHVTPTAPPSGASDPWKLLWIGRMRPEKGAQYFLESAERALRCSGKNLSLTLIGDGSEKEKLQKTSRLLTDGWAERLSIRFLGWKSQDEVTSELMSTHVLVFPSIWPEPYGLAGLEALSFGVPVVGFRAGAIPEWLTDNRNGHLAELQPDPAENLAEAVLKTISDVPHFQSLQEGALASALSFSKLKHVENLNILFRSLMKEKGIHSDHTGASAGLAK